MREERTKPKREVKEILTTEKSTVILSALLPLANLITVPCSRQSGFSKLSGAASRRNEQSKVQTLNCRKFKREKNKNRVTFTSYTEIRPMKVNQLAYTEYNMNKIAMSEQRFEQEKMATSLLTIEETTQTSVKLMHIISNKIWNLKIRCFSFSGETRKKRICPTILSLEKNRADFPEM